MPHEELVVYFYLSQKDLQTFEDIKELAEFFKDMREDFSYREDIHEAIKIFRRVVNNITIVKKCTEILN